MVFNSKYFISFSFILTLLLILGASLDTIYWVWFFSSFLIIFRIYSRVRFILLILELLTIISLVLILYFFIKSGWNKLYIFIFMLSSRRS